MRIKELFLIPTEQIIIMGGYFFKRRCIALFFLVLFSFGNILPLPLFALTSGPAQPEMTSFQAAGVTDMVDLFTGDFKYNIPLLDIDGYPVNLSYQSGIGVDDEASWVGLGWNLNVGSINRQLRGLPDDFSGDIVRNEQYQKPKVTIGGEIYVKPEFKGKLGPSLSGKLSMGIFNDNYTGIGASIGANAGIDFNLINGNDNTSGLGLNAGFGLGVSSHTSSGVDISPSISLSLYKKMADEFSIGLGKSATLGYNTRNGLKSLTLENSISANALSKSGLTSSLAQYDLSGSSYSYNTEPFYPKPQLSYHSISGSFTESVGGAGFAGFVGVGGTGYVNVREVKEKLVKKPAFGFLYSERGKALPDALMDFTREKDNPIIPELPNLAIPVYTPDLFSFTSQSGVGQFRLYRGGSGILFDNLAKDESESFTLGYDLGFGSYFHGGVSTYDQTINSSTQKWNENNDYEEKADFQNNTGENPNDDPVYFRQVGEKTLSDERITSLFQNDVPVAVKISNKTATDNLKFNTNDIASVSSGINKTSKAIRRAGISFLTAKEASRSGSLDQKIKNYALQENEFNSQTAKTFVDVPRNDNSIRRSNHISEFTITDDVGKRLIYGLPVYNKTEEDFTFNIGPAPNNGLDRDKNLVDIPKKDGVISTKNNGIDEYYSKQKQPAYATSFLLSGVLSPDYVDLKGDGITDDDRGSAVKFNYSKLPYDFKWRTPVQANKASYNQGLLADHEDEKGIIIYGEKELWYLHSIETKTKVAYFILATRKDALGVLDWNGGIDNNRPQKCLKKIILYSKADLTKPIKTVEFNYDYHLCKKVTNFNTLDPDTDKGKLTLTSLVFNYSNSTKGTHHPYKFTYGNNADYDALVSDRWGTYKSKSANPQSALKNDEYPYTIQDKIKADNYSSQWLLNKVDLPTGGIINVTYESDDYAYVQNKRAMKMVPLKRLRKDNNTETSDLSLAKKVELDLADNISDAQEINLIKSKSVQEQTRWFLDNYLNGSDRIYGKMYIKIATASAESQTGYDHDYVPNYAKVITAEVQSNNTVLLRLEDIAEGSPPVNSFCIAAWQKMRCEYPKYAYPGYENRFRGTDPVAQFSATISAVLNAYGNLGELKESFYSRAYRKHFAAEVDESKSYFRLTDQTGHKFGGGCRVKRLTISDEWNTMNGPSQAATAIYGTEYDYSTIESGKNISSGVASFEPSLGGDENSLREPIPYEQEIRGGLNNFFYLEQPFGESFFPAPSVGYRKVTIKNIDETGMADAQNQTGYIVNEYYTAKEFPTLVKVTPMQKNEFKPLARFDLFGGVQIHELALSQGYAFYLNDMHGKLRKESIYDRNSALISSSESVYNADVTSSGEWQLNNLVKVIDDQQNVTEKYLGRDIEMFTDMRESNFSSIGKALNIGGDYFPIPWPPTAFFLPHWPYKKNDEFKLCRSACVTKVIQTYGIIKKVIKVQNGSQSTAENIAFDPYTGDVLITKTQNEFRDDIFSVNIPAYKIYKGMAGAYNTLGTIIKNFKTDNNGNLVDEALKNFLQPGDELIDALSESKYWIIESKATVNGTEQAFSQKRVIDKNGNIYLGFAGEGRWVKIIRSGNRNIVSASAANFICMQNPIKILNGTEHLVLANDQELKDWKIIDAKAIEYDDHWAGDYNPPCQTCPDGYTLSQDGQWCESSLNEDLGLCFNICPGSYNTDNSIDGTFIKESNSSPWVNVKSGYWGGMPCTILNRQTSNNTVPSAKVPIQKTISRRSSSPSINSTQLVNTCNVSSERQGDACSPLNRSGIWFCSANVQGEKLPLNQWIGVETYIEVATSKTYYVGYGGDDRLRLYINNNPIVLHTSKTDANYKRWEIVPVTLNAGKNLIKLEGYNDEQSATMGVEIYDNTYTQLVNETAINRIFTTDGLQYADKLYSYVYNQDNSVRPRYICLSGYLPDIFNNLVCDRFKINKVNPYVQGFRGNWRSLSPYVFQVNRSYGKQASATQDGINIRQDGVYSVFNPFWTYNTSDATWHNGSLHNEKWVLANKSTLFDRYGDELESKNALNIYSSASFGFLGNMAVAVASNAKNREIFYEGFEDFNFKQNNRLNYAFCQAVDVAFNINPSNIKANLSHSGKYCLALNNSLSLTTKIHNNEHLNTPYLSTDDNGMYEYRNIPGLYPIGFEPMSSKQYIISAWVYDGQPLTKTFTTSFSAVVNGQQFNIPLGRKATVEGWKLLEGQISIPGSATGSDLTLTISGNSGSFIDDIRIFPVDGQLKTFAYDERTFRLMAELDENNFATFYEYDEEGILNRVKKETERGIMTIKETRSTYKKSN